MKKKSGEGEKKRGSTWEVSQMQGNHQKGKIKEEHIFKKFKKVVDGQYEVNWCFEFPRP